MGATSQTFLFLYSLPKTIVATLGKIFLTLLDNQKQHGISLHLVPKIKDHMIYHSWYDVQDKESTHSVPFPCLVSLLPIMLKILQVNNFLKYFEPNFISLLVWQKRPNEATGVQTVSPLLCKSYTFLHNENLCYVTALHLFGKNQHLLDSLETK